MASIEEILMNRRTVQGCTEEIWAAKKAAEEKRKAEVVANKIEVLMSATEAEVNKIVDELRAVRAKEREIKQRLEDIGRPYEYAREGLYGSTINLAKIAPLVVHSGHSLEDFGLSPDTSLEIPEEFAND